jgi:hypothetical protein
MNKEVIEHEDHVIEEGSFKSVNRGVKQRLVTRGYISRCCNQVPVSGNI